MRTITVICAYCHNPAIKPLKEVSRQIRNKGEDYRFYCSRGCYQHYKDSTKSLKWQASHYRARYYYVKNIWGESKKANCENCDKPTPVYRLEVHHKNADYLDNAPSNLQAICKPCHYFIHEKQFVK